MALGSKAKSYDEAVAECIEAVNDASKLSDNAAFSPKKAEAVRGKITWRPAKDVDHGGGLWNKDTGPRPTDVAQGCVGTCYFLAACASVAERNNGSAIKRLIPAISDDGTRFGVVLFIRGQWTYVILNDHFVCSKEKKDQPLFAHSPTKVLWPMLLEKAFVLLDCKGDYGDAEGGFEATALRVLTGAPCHRYTLQTMDTDEIWEILRDDCPSSNVIDRSGKVAPEEDQTIDPGMRVIGATGTARRLPLCTTALCGSCSKLTTLPYFCCSSVRDTCPTAYLCFSGFANCTALLPRLLLPCVFCAFIDPCISTTQRSYSGLVPQHAYSVIDAREVPSTCCGFTCCCASDQLVRVRNPWGTGEWKGAWADGDSRWTSSAKTAVGGTYSNANDGAAFMPLSDFSQYFSSLALAEYGSLDWQSTASNLVHIPKKKKHGHIIFQIDGNDDDDIDAFVSIDCMDGYDGGSGMLGTGVGMHVTVIETDSGEEVGVSRAPANLDDSLGFFLPFSHVSASQLLLKSSKKYSIIVEFNSMSSKMSKEGRCLVVSIVANTNKSISFTGNSEESFPSNTPPAPSREKDPEDNADKDDKDKPIKKSKKNKGNNKKNKKKKKDDDGDDKKKNKKKNKK